jgi:hypothetical protein
MDDDDIFIGEGPADAAQDDEPNPLALSSCDDEEETEGSSGGEGHDDETLACHSGQPEPVTEDDARALIARMDEVIAVFEAKAASVRSHPLLPAAAPGQAGVYTVAGLARLRGKLLAERRHVIESLSRGALGNLRGNNVAACCVAVAVLITESDVSATMFHAGYMPPDATERRTVELDLITDGGQRWVKVKASSPGNFAREVGLLLDGRVPGTEATAATSSWSSHDEDGSAAAAAADAGTFLPAPGDSSAPFLETLRILLRASAEPAYRLPFGRRPRIIVACAEEPPAGVRRVIRNLDPSIEVVPVTAPGAAKTRAAMPNKGSCVLPPSLFRGTQLVSGARVLKPATGYRIAAINFDVTAMVATVCDCCHGYAGFPFPRNHILQQQSMEEARGVRAVEGYILPVVVKYSRWGKRPAAREEDAAAAAQPVADELCPFASGPDAPWDTQWPLNWVASEVAIAEFRWILDTIGGPDELRRAAWLLARIRAVDPSARCVAVDTLRTTNRIQDRHRAVFGAGDAAGAVTLSGNRTFVQAAQEQGVSLLVAFHPSRALTERKRLGMEHEPSLPPVPMPPAGCS